MTGLSAKASTTVQPRPNDSEAWQRQLLDSAPMPMALVAADLSVVYANPAFEALTLAGAAATGALAQFVHEDDRQALMLRIDQVLRHEIEKFSLDCRLLRSSDPPVWVIASGAAVSETDPDKMPSCLLQFADIDR